ncbi:MAG: lactonase family protein, partial [Nitrospira sp. CG24A]
VTVDPSGRTAYVANGDSDTISQYHIGATGALTPLSPPTVSTGDRPTSVTVNPSGRTAYATNSSSHTVSQYNIDETGALTPPDAITQIVATRNGPNSIAITRGTSPVVYRPKWAYVANAGIHTVSQFSIGTTGALTPLSPPAVGTGDFPNSVTVDPSGRTAYVTNGDSD